MRATARLLRVAVAVRAFAVLAVLFFVLLTFDRYADARLTDQADVEFERARFQAIIDGIGDGVVVADARGRFTLFNPAAERILGMGPADSDPEQWSAAYGLYLPDGLTPYPPERLPLARAIAGETVRDVEIVVRNAKRPGGVRISVTCTPIHAGDGSRAGAVSVFRDVSERA
ncbi:MAG: PAS domain-containing protein [Elusimicrobia bacterium]|nr:PAS domain-containing protein [Elusimicrobiota bacterium]